MVERSLIELLCHLTENAIAINELRVYVALSKEGELFSCPMKIDGYPLKDEVFIGYFAFEEVKNPSQKFIDLVNEKLGTKFTVAQFADW